MATLEAELWVDHPDEAVRFYEAGFGALVELSIGTGDDRLARLDVDGARFWVGGADPSLGRGSPRVGVRTSRTLLVVDDPDALVARAVAAGAELTAPVADEHGWRLGRLVDPGGHEWEVGHPLDG
jgi:PhnB protein